MFFNTFFYSKQILIQVPKLQNCFHYPVPSFWLHVKQCNYMEVFYLSLDLNAFFIDLLWHINSSRIISISRCFNCIVGPFLERKVQKTLYFLTGPKLMCVLCHYVAKIWNSWSSVSLCRVIIFLTYPYWQIFIKRDHLVPATLFFNCKMKYSSNSRYLLTVWRCQTSINPMVQKKPRNMTACPKLSDQVINNR